MDERIIEHAGLGDIKEKVDAGVRLSLEDGRRLFACPDIAAVGALAHHVRLKKHGRQAFYIPNRHVNYTNICVNSCRFCAFRRRRDAPDAYCLSVDEAVDKIADAGPIAEAHIVGGCHPDLRLSHFIELLSRVKIEFPQLTVKAFTAEEIDHFAGLEGLSTLDVLKSLKEAGLDMLPGGGAEIFEPELRAAICPDKVDGARWLRIHGEAHGLGIQSNATMLYGHKESIDDRLRHLDALREQQDESGGFLCFIPLPFLAKNNPMAGEGSRTGLDDLRMIAVSRLMLDNIEHIKAYWVMLSEKVAQVGLHFGADDLDGTIVEEKIGHDAGAESEQAMTTADMEHIISACGFQPALRDAFYNPAGGSRVEFVHAAAPDDDRTLWDLARKPLNGERLSAEEALELYLRADLHALAAAAHAVRLMKHPEPVVTYVVDRNINYSNVCVCGCRFCAYYRPLGHEEGFVLTRDELEKKIEETLAVGGRQILLQGGHHPELPLSFYEDMLAFIKEKFPTVHIHAFSPPEIVHFGALEGLSTAEVIRRLKDSGLASIPGGGAEILVDAVRKEASPNKCPAGEWLRVMEEAHALGLRTTATMMFGHEDTPADRIAHLFALRDSQDRTGGYTAFIPWSFQPGNTDIQARTLPSPAYLRMLAMSRLVLDNIDNVQASWVTQGSGVAQLALFFGANDFGSTMLEENVVAAAGVRFRLSEDDIRKLVQAAGFEPRRRTMAYALLEDAAAHA